MRGQLANSPGIRVGFEGGQMPLYRRLPKLRGIAGGMPAGRKTHVTVNLSLLDAAVAAGKLAADAEVTLATLKEAGLLKATGAERNLPLKVLAGGELSSPLKIAANAFSAGAREKIASAGGSLIEVAGKAKWSRSAHESAVKAAGGSVVQGKSIPVKAAASKASKAKKA
jgi:large subunit ribosomal protein L15